MELHKFNIANSLLASAKETAIEICILPSEEGELYIDAVLEKFKPWKTTGHLQIGDSAKKISTETNEHSFSLQLHSEPAFIFFDQSSISKKTVVKINDAKKISSLLTNSSGVECFISNTSKNYLIAVNWYTIEYTGEI